MERKLPSPDNPRLGIKGASKNRESLQIFKSFIYLYFLSTHKKKRRTVPQTQSKVEHAGTPTDAKEKEICDRHYGLKVLRNHSE